MKQGASVSQRFRAYKATHQLKELAEHPYDLTQEGALSIGRIEAMQCHAAGWSLCYGMQRVSEETMQALKLLAHEAGAVKKMQAMQRGEILNKIAHYPSEERAVLHTAMRDFFSTACAPEATELAKAECDKLKHFLEEIEKKKQFTDIVQIGIGGSDLGPRALCIALEGYHRKNHRAHFISNVDPDDAAATLQRLDLSKTLVVIVSKSGKTLETLTNEEIARSHLTKAGCDPKEHCIAVTGKGSPMDDPSRYLASFYIWDYIGGRYSATSMIGGVVLGFALGFDKYYEILRGAHAMDLHARTAEGLDNLPLLCALLGIWNRNFLHSPTLAVLPYSQALSRFAAHLQQLDMESNGKRIDKEGQRADFETGPLIWGEPGTNGQHSFYQFLHQGTLTVPMEFIGFRENVYSSDLLVHGTTSQEKLLANLFAQMIAFAQGQKNDNPNKEFPGNRPSSLLLAPRLTPQALGALLALYEHKVAFQGFIWNINSFDQEGVELGKVTANRILDLFAAKRSGKKAASFPLAEALIKQLDLLS